MSSFPLPVRVAAGLAVTAVEQTRQLPRSLVGLPVTLVSQALQASMRVQQQVTQLAIKGDDALDGLRTPEEQPSWATFDEDDGEVPAAADFPSPDRSGEPPHDPVADEPISAESLPGEPVPSAPAIPADYDQLTLPQLRGKLRGFTAADLEELLDYERAHAQRPEFLRMLSNRLDRVRSRE
jgi:hypothetical protein